MSYKQGYLGTEDFFAPEHKATNRFGQSADEVPGEVCTTTSGGWGYNAGVPFNSPEGVSLFRSVADRIKAAGTLTGRSPPAGRS